MIHLLGRRRRQSYKLIRVDMNYKYADSVYFLDLLPVLYIVIFGGYGSFSS